MKLLSKMMTRFVQVGRLKIIDAEGEEHVFGPGGDGTPHAVAKIHDAALYNSLFVNPELKAGEAYVDGTLTMEEGYTIRDFLNVFALNRDALRTQPIQKALKTSLKKVRRFHQRNKVTKSRENVQHHYDLSNDFYKLFLDKDMQYSLSLIHI